MFVSGWFPCQFVMFWLALGLISMTFSALETALKFYAFSLPPEGDPRSNVSTLWVVIWLAPGPSSNKQECLD